MITKKDKNGVIFYDTAFSFGVLNIDQVIKNERETINEIIERAKMDILRQKNEDNNNSTEG